MKWTYHNCKKCSPLLSFFFLGGGGQIKKIREGYIYNAAKPNPLLGLLLFTEPRVFCLIKMWSSFLYSCILLGWSVKFWLVSLHVLRILYHNRIKAILFFFLVYMVQNIQMYPFFNNAGTCPTSYMLTLPIYAKSIAF